MESVHRSPEAKVFECMHLIFSHKLLHGFLLEHLLVSFEHIEHLGLADEEAGVYPVASRTGFFDESSDATGVIYVDDAKFALRLIDGH